MLDGEQYASKRPSQEKSCGEETTEAGGLRGGRYTGNVECKSGTGIRSKLFGSGSNGADRYDKSVSLVRRSNAMTRLLPAAENPYPKESGNRQESVVKRGTSQVGIQ